MSDLTQRLREFAQGDRQASSDLLPLVYRELRSLAAAKMANERSDHTLSATALVHEAYVRVAGSSDASKWDGRGHFFAAAAEAMRRILVDHARNSRRLKRGGEARRVQIEGIELVWEPQFGDILDLHEALDGLSDIAPQAAELVKLRCFAGQSFVEAAALLGISERTAKRRWSFARAWLFQAIEGVQTDSGAID